MNILDEINAKLDSVLAALGGSVEAATSKGKRGGKKAEAPQPEDTPALPGGLTISEVDVQQPPSQVNIPQSTLVQQDATTLQAPLAASAPAAVADPAVVGQTIKTQLDVMAPNNPPLRAMLGQFSGDWLAQQGLAQNQVTMDHVPQLLAYCQDRLNAHLQQAQQPATTGGY